jgi:hypothetical protein
MNPVQEFKQLCAKYRVEDAEFVCKRLMEANEYSDLELWRVVVPFNTVFTGCVGEAPTKQLAKELCALQCIPLCKFGHLSGDEYGPLITLCVSGGIKIPGSKGRRTPLICVPKYKYPIEQCASSAFNRMDVLRRCRENLDEMFASLDVATDKAQTIQDKLDEEEQAEYRQSMEDCEKYAAERDLEKKLEVDRETLK